MVKLLKVVLIFEKDYKKIWLVGLGIELWVN